MSMLLHTAARESMMSANNKHTFLTAHLCGHVIRLFDQYSANSPPRSLPGSPTDPSCSIQPDRPTPCKDCVKKRSFSLGTFNLEPL